MNRSRVNFGGLIGILLAVSAAPVCADSIAASLVGTPGSPLSSGSNMSLGRHFTTSAAITVTQLGYYDLAPAGLAAAATVWLPLRRSIRSLGN